jgi:hypothetical protein
MEKEILVFDRSRQQLSTLYFVGMEIAEMDYAASATLE